MASEAKPSGPSPALDRVASLAMTKRLIESGSNKQTPGARPGFV
jgi:hypothetical protein